MATPDVSDEIIMQAHCDGWINRLGGAEHLSMRELGDGRAVYLDELLFDGLRLGIGRVGADSYLDVWDYQLEQARDAWRSAIAWDGEGEPEGWYRHLRTGRRRPGGDASKERVDDGAPPALSHCLECGAPAHDGACVYSEPMAELLQVAERLAGGPLPDEQMGPFLLLAAVELGHMSEQEARDLEAFADGLDARVIEGELTAEQAGNIGAAQAVRDGEAILRARARAQGEPDE
jgi:hypothetical protein